MDRSEPAESGTELGESQMTSREHKALRAEGLARSAGWPAIAVLLGASTLLGGCASSPNRNMPTEQFTRTDDAIKESIEHGARDSASAELAAAEEHFQKAQAAANDKEYEIALLYAEKAEADAKLAEAKAERAQTTGNLKELQDSIQDLKDEVNRQLSQSDQQG
jgi:multidrug resistance efflux pump